MKFLASFNNLSLIILIIIILLMIILPMPSFFMDLTIALNVSMSIMILLIALNLQQPLEFSTFPTVLLLTTLFRLSISIATTRSILLNGEAGDIITSFGDVVVGGNIVVGLVVFIIITLVQFLVITKGADRVAEVSARFTLDGLPGKQMSIDADIRAGLIDQLEAQKLRQILAQETKLFGAMDGAMKFVKGDAIAGLFITAINLIGGIIIGMAQRGLDFSSALEIYSLMTIGDGLVAQIPALLISMAAGIIVTRVTDKDSSALGTDMKGQFISEPKTVQIATLIIALFGFLPGFPTLVFLSVGFIIFALTYYFGNFQAKKADEKLGEWDGMVDAHQKLCQKQKLISKQPASLKLILPQSVKQFNVNRLSVFLDGLKHKLEKDYGLHSGYFEFEFHQNEQNNHYQIFLMDQRELMSGFNAGQLYVRSDQENIEHLGFEFLDYDQEKRAGWIDAKHAKALSDEKIEYQDAMALMCSDVEQFTYQNKHYFINYHNVTEMLNQLRKSHKNLTEAVEGEFPIDKLIQIFKWLIMDHIPLTHKSVIFEEMLKWAETEKDLLVLTEHIRARIREQITRLYTRSSFLKVTIVTPAVENLLRDALQKTSNDSFLVLDPEKSEAIIDNVAEIYKNPFDATTDPVLITQPDVRYHFKRLLNEFKISVPVISYKEVSEEVNLYPISYINVEEGAY